MIKANNIYLGDAYELIKQVPDNSVDLIVTDPPYEIETQGGKTNIGKSYQKGIAKELRDLKIIEGIQKEILLEFLRVLKKPNIYIWCNKKQIIQYLDFFVTQRGFSFEILTWLKPNPTPLCGGNYLIDKEFCLYFRKNVRLNTNFETAKTFWIEKVNVNDKKHYKHPTIKPLNILKTIIANSSKENDVVLDPFLGSGTTAIASKELNRKYIGFEIDEKYFKIAKDRINGIDAYGQTSIFTDFTLGVIK